MKVLHDFKLALITLLSLLIMACSSSVPTITPKQAAELLNNKHVVMIDVRCRSGRRSDVAAKTLIKAGFTKVVNLEGGILAWDEQGLATVKGP